MGLIASPQQDDMRRKDHAQPQDALPYPNRHSSHFVGLDLREALAYSQGLQSSKRNGLSHLSTLVLRFWRKHPAYWVRSSAQHHLQHMLALNGMWVLMSQSNHLGQWPHQQLLILEPLF